MSLYFLLDTDRTALFLPSSVFMEVEEKTDALPRDIGKVERALYLSDKFFTRDLVID